MNTNRTLTAAAIVLTLSLTGCAGAGELTQASAPQAASTPTESPETTLPTYDEPTYDPADEATEEPVEEPEETYEPSPEPTEDPADSMTAAWGEQFTYEDDLVVQIDKPMGFTPSEWAMTGDHPTNLKFKVSLTNGTTEPFDASSGLLYASAGGMEGEEIFDTDNDLDGTPDTRVLPGRTVTFWVGFGLDARDDLVVQYAPSFDHKEVLYSAR